MGITAEMLALPAPVLRALQTRSIHLTKLHLMISPGGSITEGAGHLLGFLALFPGLKDLDLTFSPRDEGDLFPELSQSALWASSDPPVQTRLHSGPPCRWRRELAGGSDAIRDEHLVELLMVDGLEEGGMRLGYREPVSEGKVQEYELVIGEEGSLDCTAMIDGLVPKQLWE